MMVYAIKLSKKKNEQEFEQFMREEVFPQIDKRSLRNGQINGLVLYKGNTTGHTNEYLWFIYGGVNGGAAVKSVDTIESFGARVSPLQEYEECISWFAGDTKSNLSE